MVTLSRDEVFPNPTVKQVIFQIRFPPLFFLESRVGDLQVELMERFPKSELHIQRTVIFAQGAQKDLIEQSSRQGDANDVGGPKIWKFRSGDDVSVEVQQDSVTIITNKHKSYRSGAGCFREVISFILERFHKVTPIPIVTRVGLRYVDECPIPEFNTTKFAEYYETALPVVRFAIESSTEMAFRTVVSRGTNRQLRYQETVTQPATGPKLVLDFDAFAESVKWDQVLSTADELHQIIRKEYEATIKEPVLAYMRAKQGD